MTIVISGHVPHEESHAEMARLENRPIISFRIPTYIADMDDGYMSWSPEFGVRKAANTKEAAESAVVGDVMETMQNFETFEEREEYIKSTGMLYNVYHPDGSKEVEMVLTA